MDVLPPAAHCPPVNHCHICPHCLPLLSVNQGQARERVQQYKHARKTDPVLILFNNVEKRAKTLSYALAVSVAVSWGFNSDAWFHIV